MRSDSLAPPSDHRDRNLFVYQPDLTRELPTAHPWHTDIGKYAIKLVLAEQRQRFAATLRQIDFAAFTFENLSQYSLTKSSSSTTSSLVSDLFSDCVSTVSGISGDDSLDCLDALLNNLCERQCDPELRPFSIS